METSVPRDDREDRKGTHRMQYGRGEGGLRQERTEREGVSKAETVWRKRKGGGGNGGGRCHIGCRGNGVWLMDTAF